MYVLLNLKRRKLGVRELVTCWNKPSSTRWRNMVLMPIPGRCPGVYVGEMKICSLGLRIRKGCSFHMVWR
jgi:lipoyl(octanoyl) transferase